MSTFLERLVKEKEQVNGNLIKLDDYISTSDHFKSLSIANQLLLQDQRHAMNTYVNILTIRIELNNK